MRQFSRPARTMCSMCILVQRESQRWGEEAGDEKKTKKPCSLIIIAFIRPRQVSQEMDTANVIAHDTPEKH